MIPEAAVEAATKVVWDMADSIQSHEYAAEIARAALDAAAPHMLAELRSHVADQILAANNAEGFTEFAAGWVAALKNVHERLTK